MIDNNAIGNSRSSARTIESKVSTCTPRIHVTVLSCSLSEQIPFTRRILPAAYREYRVYSIDNIGHFLLFYSFKTQIIVTRYLPSAPPPPTKQNNRTHPFSSSTSYLLARYRYKYKYNYSFTQSIQKIPGTNGNRRRLPPTS